MKMVIARKMIKTVKGNENNLMLRLFVVKEFPNP